jgi:hypothetical protein
MDIPIMANLITHRSQCNGQYNNAHAHPYTNLYLYTRIPLTHSLTHTHTLARSRRYNIYVGICAYVVIIIYYSTNSRATYETVARLNNILYCYCIKEKKTVNRDGRGENRIFFNSFFSSAAAVAKTLHTHTHT